MNRTEPLPTDHSPHPARGLTFFQTTALATVLASLIVGGTAAWERSNPISQFVEQSPTTVQNPRIVVVKSARRVHLFEGERLIRSYPVTLGPEPTGQKRRAGDGRTPEGNFRICSKNAASPHHRFLGISYPDRRAAKNGLNAGLVSPGEARAIIDADRDQRCPVWTTALGGAIGLHGAANAGRTAGCIALLDQHVEELFDVLRIGDHVEILP